MQHSQTNPHTECWIVDCVTDRLIALFNCSAHILYVFRCFLFTALFQFVVSTLQNRIDFDPRSDVHHRWITPSEAMMFQGFPVLKSLSYDVVTCSFAKRNAESVVSTEALDDGSASKADNLEDGCASGRTATMGQAGNAMHTECVGIFILYVLTGGGDQFPSKHLVALSRQTSARSHLFGPEHVADSNSEMMIRASDEIRSNVLLNISKMIRGEPN